MKIPSRRSFSEIKNSNTKLLVVVSGALLLLVIYFLIHNYQRQLNQYKQEVLSRLDAIARTSVLLINGDEHAQLANEFPKKDAITSANQNDRYLALHKILCQIQKSNNLESPVYTIVYNDQGKTFHFIGTSSSHPYFRHTYINYPKKLLQDFNIGGKLDMYHDENGVWLSAFAPIKNHLGETVALLEVDEHFESFIAMTKVELWNNVLISLLVTLPFGIGLIRFIMLNLRKKESYQAKLLEQKEEIETQNELIEIQNRELDQRVKERTKALENANLELTNFLYHSSHDVQAPIATLKGLYLLAIQETKDTKALEYFKLSLDTTARLERMVKTIQNVHEIKTVPLQYASVCLKALATEVINQVTINKEKIIFNIKIVDELEIETDARIIHTILFELLKNSVQYNSSENAEITISAKSESNTINLEIDDNGEGIPEEYNNEIFKMFKRSNQKSNGVGLGLFIVQSCLVRLGGEIKLINKQEPGTKFLIRLPLEP